MRSTRTAEFAVVATVAGLATGAAAWLAATAPELTSAVVQVAVSTPVRAPSPAATWTSLRIMAGDNGIRLVGNDADAHLDPRPNGERYDRHRNHHGPGRTNSDGNGDQPRWTVQPRPDGRGWTVCRPHAASC
ncbi:hypothetical protein [Nocardia yamanashiensis]|uniref:hypothetical protein n=1 Tax=Nocardia yamanashiensis TaxID=209247 RepID=UPI00082A59D4|nr:hypothetical protein [Nocardia yamanashiensis]